jgi:hypothetical protein
MLVLKFDNKEVYLYIFLEHQVSAKSMPMAMLEFGNFTMLLITVRVAVIKSKIVCDISEIKRISLFRYTSQY